MSAYMLWQVPVSHPAPDWSSTRTAFEWATSVLDKHLDDVDASLATISKAATAVQVRSFGLQFHDLPALDAQCILMDQWPHRTLTEGIRVLPNFHICKLLLFHNEPPTKLSVCALVNP